jgi:O-antigen/teichoic acid export membrane protein
MPFLGFQGTLAISNTLIFLMLSKYASETEVGYYNAANQILAPLILIVQSFVFSAFPAMCRRFEADVRGLKSLSDNLIELLIAITLPVLVGLFYLAEEILLLLYGNQEFVFASGILRLMLITLVLWAVTSVLGRDLLASHREKIVLKIVLVGSVLNVLSGFLLIRRFGLVGAAITAVFFALIDFFLHYIYTSRLFSTPIPWRRLWTLVIATGTLTVFLAVVKIPAAITAFLIGSVIYLIVWLFLNIRSAGSLKQLKLKYQILWSEPS